MTGTDTYSNAVTIARDLVRCESVTPVEGGALDLLQSLLTDIGFTCHRLPFSEEGEADVDNLYARLGTEAPHFCFAGHTDVVPTGDDNEWTVAPFSGEIREGVLWGRGTADMKGAIAAFVAAVQSYLSEEGTPAGSISFLITGDEEGPAVNGTAKMLQWLEQQGEVIDHCLVGEPTNPETFGEMMKIGRRGSVVFDVTVTGAQGHVAYPHKADNPLPWLGALAAAIGNEKLDDGNAHFEPSVLSLTTIDVGNPATNVIPASGFLRSACRFNTEHSPESLVARITALADKVTEGRASVKHRVYGEPFLTPPGLLSDIISEAVEAETGRKPELSTTGGTSDARFIKSMCPVVEFGLVGRTMHKVDEHVAIADIDHLTAVYRRILSLFFSRAAG